MDCKWTLGLREGRAQPGWGLWGLFWLQPQWSGHTCCCVCCGDWGVSALRKQEVPRFSPRLLGELGHWEEGEWDGKESGETEGNRALQSGEEQNVNPVERSCDLFCVFPESRANGFQIKVMLIMTVVAKTVSMTAISAYLCSRYGTCARACVCVCACVYLQIEEARTWWGLVLGRPHLRC